MARGFVGQSGRAIGLGVSSKRVSGMQLYRLRRGMVMGRALRRAVKREEMRHDEAWTREMSDATRARLGKDRPRCQDGRAIGTIWNGDVARLAAKGIGATGNVRRVARTLGIDSQTLYRHRQSEPGFAAQWEDELSQRYARLELAALDRLTDGWDEEVYHGGHAVGTRRRYDHASLIALLRLRRQTEATWYERQEKAEMRSEEAARRVAEAEKLAAAEGKEMGRHDEHGLTDKDYLLAEMMIRHRNRHPEEWDGDLHVSSGINLADCPAYDVLMGQEM